MAGSHGPNVIGNAADHESDQEEAKEHEVLAGVRSSTQSIRRSRSPSQESRNDYA